MVEPAKGCEALRLSGTHEYLHSTGGTFANVIRLQLPLTLSAAEADRICDVFSDAVAKLSAGKK